MGTFSRMAVWDLGLTTKEGRPEGFWLMDLSFNWHAAPLRRYNTAMRFQCLLDSDWIMMTGTPITPDISHSLVWEHSKSFPRATCQPQLPWDTIGHRSEIPPLQLPLFLATLLSTSLLRPWATASLLWSATMCEDTHVFFSAWWVPFCCYRE